MSAEHKLAELRHVLVEQQLPSGGWPALASSSQTVLEPTVYSILALGPGFQNEYQRARQFLLHSQNPNGSWPAFADDDNKGSWATALALVALRDNFEDLPVRLKGFTWLLQCAGKESSWLWKWQFRTVDRHVRFDPEKFGWPWQPATNSWVVPNSFRHSRSQSTALFLWFRIFRTFSHSARCRNVARPRLPDGWLECRQRSGLRHISCSSSRRYRHSTTGVEGPC